MISDLPREVFERTDWEMGKDEDGFIMNYGVKSRFGT
ncbi:hypothetical protein D1BOALGB6SA_5434 [Olavius sp. associated proteobacterium Delta 1]|nr:hypothetical protein D1BOALGB6SA_5434 [Olavius sp. associated proteobacterium Delta 1]